MYKENVRVRLRTHRRSWGLTQSELAKLLGFKSPNHISRIEAGKRLPGIESALTCQVLFGVPPDILFPIVYAKVEERTMDRIGHLHKGLLQISNPIALRKREFCEKVLERTITRANPTGV